MALTPKQERFAQEYLVDMNATQAAIRAGYSAHTAEQQGPRLLGNAEIRRYIDSRRAKVADKLEITLERYLEKQWNIGRRFEDADDHRAASVGSQALERAAKAAGFLTEKVQHSGEQTVRVVRE